MNEDSCPSLWLIFGNPYNLLRFFKLKSTKLPSRIIIKMAIQYNMVYVQSFKAL